MTGALSHTLEGVQRPSDRARHSTPKVTSDGRRQPKQPQRETHALPHYAYPTANSTARLRASAPLVPSNSASSPASLSLRSKPRPRRIPAPHKHRPNAAPSDPEYITQLWKSVAVYGAENQSSKGGGKKGAPSTTGTLTLASTSTSRPPQHQTLATPTSPSQKSKRQPAARVFDSDFETAVLTMHKITIEGESLTQSFDDHFSLSLSRLPNDCIERFNVYREKFALNVWLEPDHEHAKRIQEEFCAMKDYGCSEAEFAAYALQEVFLDERRYPTMMEPAEVLMAPVRMLELVQRLKVGKKPISGAWKAPTRLALSEKQYEWDIRPDCAYYISLRAFPLSFRPNVRKFVFVAQDRACCPYLTVTFKKHVEAPQTATNRAAIASAIALYDRWHLKHKALQRLGIADEWPEDHENQLRHYSIVLVGAAWELWYTTPKTYHIWSGCTMSQMTFGDCSNANSVALLLSILNDIHYWGLAVHGKSCLADIGILVKGDASRVSWLSENSEDLEIGTA
ncbi:hypothetical protein SAMD00023353_0800960 [Rosellinia necatrix]|uniref:Uncharacterized protein n=1 Tax=Rosellinia necatrix TaxID=77044 RepID=A0A1W2TAY7_ROSNE|nr:hypothetical protein SAMD00023353_0800960 [Rosellinia necatrix]